MSPDRRPVVPRGVRLLVSREARPVALVAVAILVASLVPLGGIESGVPGADKLLHVVGHALLAATALRWRRPGTLGGVLAIVVAATGYGAGVELLQAATPTRTPSLLDALANAVGAALGAGLWVWRRRLA